jgi:hypothetical protein
MARPYLCPICRENRSRFMIIYKLAQQVNLDEVTGDPVYEAPELETVARSDGRPDIEVRCLKCDYTAKESTFIKAQSRHQDNLAEAR